MNRLEKHYCLQILVFLITIRTTLPKEHIATMKRRYRDNHKKNIKQNSVARVSGKLYF